MFWKLFGRHPASVGESYVGHLRHALSFGFTLLVAGLACIVHAILPFAFERTGSNVIRTLYGRMVVNRAGAATGNPADAQGGAE